MRKRMSKPTLNINGMTVEFQTGQTILEVARAAGIYTIPTLCYLKEHHGHRIMPHVHGGGGRGPDPVAGLRHRGRRPGW